MLKEKAMPTETEARKWKAMGDRIKAVRLARGYRFQKEVYEPLGIKSSNYSVFEGGKKGPSHPALVKVSEFLNCPIEYILSGDTGRLDPTLRAALNLHNEPEVKPTEERKNQIAALVRFVEEDARRREENVTPEEVIERVVLHMLEKS